jgi:hypothetical protein
VKELHSHQDYVPEEYMLSSAEELLQELYASEDRTLREKEYSSLSSKKLELKFTAEVYN